jgi:diacylglycerol O-acyltransferase / wax synthase
MGLMPVTESMFLLAETRDAPIHVGGLQIFELPDGAGPDFVSDQFERLLEVGEVETIFQRRPQRSVASLGQWSWVADADLDLEYHVRHSALPRPGRVRELLALGSRLHGSLLDRNRPLWEFHLIEGLEGGRCAAYTKIHHAVLDGVSALRLLERSLSEDPDAVVAPPWAARPKRAAAEGDGGIDPAAAVREAARTLGDLIGTGPAIVRSAQRAMKDQLAAYPFQAPPSMLNVRITGARRFAADKWSLDRVRRLGTASGATVNDVVLAMCGGALRRYLADQDALPGDPLIAMVPVSLRDDDEIGGNAVGAVLCNLGTDRADPAERLEVVQASMVNGKANLAGLSQIQASILGAGVMAPMALMGLAGGGSGLRPAFNVIISNIPGPRAPLFWNGARLEGLYPMSVPFHGQALNITVTSYVDDLEFGLMGCRRSVPRLQGLLGHLGQSLDELEDAVGGP